MTAPARVLALIALVAISLIVYFAGPGSSSGATGGPRLFTTSMECKDCHAEVFEEWKTSHHAIAYTNPEVRRLSEDFRNKECQACHLPRPIFETGLAKRPLPREDRPNEGVDCLACHLDENGRIVGRHANASVACSPIARPEFLDMAHCESCHNQHKTTDQWRASKYPEQKVDCNSCHMPELTRKSGRKGRGHVFHGAHDVATLRKAADFRVNRDGDVVHVEVENNGAGHNFPTEERHRAVDVIYRYGDEGPFQRLYRFRQPYLGDPTPDTQLPAHQTWRGKISIDASKGNPLVVRLVYKLTPFVEDEKAALLFEKRIELR